MAITGFRLPGCETRREQGLAADEREAVGIDGREILVILGLLRGAFLDGMLDVLGLELVRMDALRRWHTRSTGFSHGGSSHGEIGGLGAGAGQLAGGRGGIANVRPAPVSAVDGRPRRSVEADDRIGRERLHPPVSALVVIIIIIIGGIPHNVRSGIPHPRVPPVQRSPRGLSVRRFCVGNIGFHRARRRIAPRRFGQPVGLTLAAFRWPLGRLRASHDG